jgi:hypothetical protein
MRFRDVARLAVLALVVVVWMQPTASAFELTGQWDFVFDTEGGVRRTPVTLQLNGEQVSGKFDKSDIQGTFRGGKLDLKFPHYSAEGGLEAELSLQGSVEGDGLKGGWRFGEHGGAWTATKVKQTQQRTN